MGLGAYRGEPLHGHIMTLLAEKKNEYQAILGAEKDTTLIFRAQGAMKALDDLEYILTDEDKDEE